MGRPPVWLSPGASWDVLGLAADPAVSAVAYLGPARLSKVMSVKMEGQGMDILSLGLWEKKHRPVHLWGETVSTRALTASRIHSQCPSCSQGRVQESSLSCIDLLLATP